MALYAQNSPGFSRAMQYRVDTQPSQGVNQQTTVRNNMPSSSELITGQGLIDAMGQGNPVAGGIGTAIGGPNMSTGAALGYDFGKKADNPWEAFIAGGVGANEQGMGSFLNLVNGSGNRVSPAAWVPQDPVSNFVAGGISGLLGFVL